MTFRSLVIVLCTAGVTHVDAARPQLAVKSAYNRNALKDSIVVGDLAIGLTNAGTLLRFRLPEVVLTGEYSGRVPIACLGQKDGAVVVADEEGAIYRLDLARMAVVYAGRAGGKPVWISPGEPVRGVASIVVVTEGSEHRTHDADGSPGDYDAVVLNLETLPGGRSRRLDGEFFGLRTFLLNGRRLWVGVDQGEWGGRIGQVDLESGSQKWFDSSGLYGFAAIEDRVLAFGGGMHLGLVEAFIATIRDGALSKLYEAGNFDPDVPDAVPAKDRPIMPISAIVPDTSPGKLLVFSYGRVFRVDPAWTTWADVTTIELEYASGRPAAVGTLPSIVRVHPMPDNRSFLIATSFNGYLVLRGDQVTSRAVPHQPAGGTFDKLVPFGTGIAFVDTAEALSPQYVAGDDWKPFPMIPNEAEEHGWCDAFVSAGGGGSLLIKVNACAQPGTQILSRWRDGRVEELHRWAASDWWQHLLATPDGSIWDFSGGRIDRLENGTWADAAAEGDDARCHTEEGRSIDFQEVVSEVGPPWLILIRRLSPEQITSRLTLLTYDEGFRSARLCAVELDSADTLDVYDAVALDAAHTLIATSAGLRVFDTHAKSTSVPAFKRPPSSIRALARDRLGRVWMGGKGLWMWDGRTLVDFRSRLSATGSHVQALAADPDSGGVVALLERGMVLFLEAR